MKLFILALLPTLVFATSHSLIRVEGSVDAMGTGFSIVAYGEDRGRVESAVAQGLEEARRLDEMLSNYKPDSEWSQMNSQAADHPFRASSELFNLLSACLEYSRQSEGTFDISVGPLMKLWGFYKGTGHLPHRAEVRGALSLVGYGNVVLEASNHRVRFAKRGVELDPGGIGKGYAVDRIAQILKGDGVQHALISGGGSSIYAIGAPPDGQGWKVDIKNPRDPSKPVESVFLMDESMSTSGTYEQFFRAEGRLFSHIMDPRTGYPAQGMLSVSVITPQTIDSEAWAKPYYILGPHWTAQHKQKDYRVFFCEDKPGKRCEWLP
jgi:thiamine biosynthesis lipoprotein